MLRRKKHSDIITTLQYIRYPHNTRVNTKWCCSVQVKLRTVLETIATARMTEILLTDIFFEYFFRGTTRTTVFAGIRQCSGASAVLYACLRGTRKTRNNKPVHIPFTAVSNFLFTEDVRVVMNG